MSKYVSKGEVIDIVASENLATGDVVSLGSCIGVSGNDTLTGKKGILYIEGVFEMPKVASVGMSVGDKVYFNVENKNITKTDTDVPAGICVKEALATDKVVLVKIG